MFYLNYLALVANSSCLEEVRLIYAYFVVALKNVYFKFLGFFFFFFFVTIKRKLIYKFRILKLNY
jgi:hypothetical protein